MKFGLTRMCKSENLQYSFQSTLTTEAKDVDVPTYIRGLIQENLNGCKKMVFLYLQRSPSHLLLILIVRKEQHHTILLGVQQRKWSILNNGQPFDHKQNKKNANGSDEDLTLEQAISELPLASFSKRVLVLIFSYENQFSFACESKLIFI